jgi:hypothetical protein
MRASTTETIVASGFGHAPLHFLEREDCGFRDNYNKDSYLDEADMNS